MTNINPQFQTAGNYIISGTTSTGTGMFNTASTIQLATHSHLVWGRPALEFLKEKMENGTPIIKIVTEGDEAFSVEVIVVQMFESVNHTEEFLLTIPEDFDPITESFLDLAIALGSDPNNVQNPFMRLAELSKTFDPLIQVVYTVDDVEKTIALGDLIKLIIG